MRFMFMTTLAELDVPGGCSVLRVADGYAEIQSRLYALGLLPGVRVEVLRRAPLGDPLQVRVGTTLLSIRRADAALIDVSPEETEKAVTPEATG